MNYVIDFDDFCSSNTDWHLIEKLKEVIPNLKLNLFTVPGLCDSVWLNDMRQIDWIQMIPHGWLHKTSRECEYWNYKTCDNYLDQMMQENWIHGFKAPGWQISDGMYQALLEKGWWVADQQYNDYRRPEELRTYLLDSPNKIHGHIGNWGGQNANALEYIYDQIAVLQGDFLFIDDIV